MNSEDQLAKPVPPLSPEVVVQWLLTGATEGQVRETLQEKYPTADHGAAMQTAQAYMQAAGAPNAQMVRGWALLAYRRLYQEMFRIGDYDGCRKVVKELVGMLPKQ